MGSRLLANNSSTSRPFSSAGALYLRSPSASLLAVFFRFLSSFIQGNPIADHSR